MPLPNQIAPHAVRETCIRLIETERLLLRAPRTEDAKTIAILVNDRRIAENTLRIPHPYGIADAQRFITGTNAGSGETVFLIVRRDATVLGACGLAKRAPESAELGYWLAFAFWGNGYATEAAGAVIDYAFEDLGYEMLHAGARVSNLASRRVLEKCGFEWTGVELHRIRSLASSAPFDRFRLGRSQWATARQQRVSVPSTI
ncbi:MAG TPA: GNAT family N-acetyltransferase [Xanthobacteraceae bacterium]|jgi:RimJ/RimL family protein N-acetyltransferase|nr:GNAT family N-acetyltransferase [Xanthobacteraceae bacterium]